MAATAEVLLRFTGDARQLKETLALVRTDQSRSAQQQTQTAKQEVQAALALQRQRSAALLAQFKQEEREATRAAQARLREEAKALRQKIAEEQRAAREVARITAETARQAIAQERIRERAAKQLADVQIREAKRAAREIERALKQQRAASASGGGSEVAIGLIGRIPGLGNVASELSAVTSASVQAGAASASLAGPIGLAVAALLAEAAAAAAVTKGLYDLTRQTAEFQGRLFDMSQQVGVSVETLSGLEILATTTGGNIETVAASLAIFQKNLEAAQDPTSKEARLLRELGVTSEDTETALRETLRALFDMGEGSAQTTAVLELFGRSGRFVNAILKESSGDLDEAIRKFRQLGIVIEGDAAQASDEFNDTLATLDFQLRGLKILIGNEIMPIILSTLTDLQRLLKENKEAVELLGVAAKVTAALISVPFKGSFIALTEILKGHKAELILIKELYEAIAELIPLIAKGVPDVSPDAIPEQPLGREDGLELLRRAQKAFQAGLRPHNLREIFPDKKEKKSAEDPGLTLLRQMQGEMRRLTEETRAQEVAQQLLDKQYKNTSQSLKDQILLVARIIDVGRAKADADKLAEQLAQKEKQEVDAARESLNQFMRAQMETLRQLQFGEKSAREETEDFIKLFPKWTNLLDETTKAQLRFNATLTDSITRTREMLELMRESVDLVPSGTSAGPELDLLERLRRERDQSLGNILSAEDVASLGLPPPPDISPWTSVFEELKLAGLDAVDGLAQGFGNLAHQFVLLGTTGPAALRKLVASVLAGVAAQAATLAVMELAYAIAALTPWGAAVYGPAAAHFKAAALFGSVAGVAALAGRAVAGNAFAQDTRAGDGASGSGGSSSGPPARVEPRPVDINRATRSPLEIALKVHVERDAGSIVDVMVQDVRNNGDFRQVMHQEMAA